MQNHPMQSSGEIGRFEVEDQPSPPADRNRSPTETALKPDAQHQQRPHDCAKMFDRQSQLEMLLIHLRELVAVLGRDEHCDWTRHFEHSLAWAEHLEANGFTQDELNELSSSITRVYGGSGSFNDYPGNPATTGMFGRDLSMLCHAVYDDAQELRVTGRY